MHININNGRCQCQCQPKKFWGQISLIHAQIQKQHNRCATAHVLYLWHFKLQAVESMAMAKGPVVTTTDNSDHSGRNVSFDKPQDIGKNQATSHEPWCPSLLYSHAG